MEQKTIRFHNIKPHWVREKGGDRMYFETIEDNIVVRYETDQLLTWN